ncbi:MAG: YicC family protein, partial [Pseudomonadota bacterium]
MIRSMTAFARQERSGPWGSLTLEVRSVNHRYLELAPRIPDELRVLEPQIRERLGARLGRGKVDLYLRYRSPESAEAGFTVNKDLAKHIAQASREVDGLLYNPAPISSLDVMRWPGVLQTPEADLEQLRSETLELLDEAIADLVTVREREGTKLAETIAQRRTAMQQVVAEVRELLPSICAHWREKLRTRISEVQVEVDEQRLEQ